MSRRLTDVRLIVSSVAVSALGTWSYNVGIAVYAYQETQSTTWVAAATVGRYIPAVLITSVGSRLVDRYPRRNVAVVADCLCALVMLALTVVAAAHWSLVAAIALAALSSGTARVQSSAALSFAGDLVAESMLARTAVLISTSEAVATALGPAIASVVLAVSGPPVLFLLNGFTFLASAALLLSVKARPRSRPAAASLAPADSDDAAFRTSVRVTWPLLASRTLAAVVYGADVVLLAVIATQVLREGTAAYGWLLAAAGAGGLLAAGLLRARDRWYGAATRSTVGLVLYALPLLVFLASPALGGSIGAQVVRGFGCVLVTATVIAGLQSAVPTAAAGRVFGRAHALMLVGTCAGALVVPVLLDAWGLDPTLLFLATVPVLLQLALVPALVRFDRRGAALLAALEPRVDTLRRLTLFHDASRATLYEVADDADVWEVPGATPVVTQGEPADALWILVAGSVEVTTDTGSGRAVLRVMDAPGYFGEIGLLHGVPRTASVTTLGPCSLWRVPGATFITATTQAGLSSALTETVRLRLGPDAITI